MSYLSKKVEEIKAWIVSESKIVISFLKPFAISISNGEEAILITAAENAVSVGFTVAGTPEAKMLAALASFSAEMIAKGVPYIESQARALIEIALQNKKVTSAAPLSSNV